MNSTFDPWSPTQPLPAALRRQRQMRGHRPRHPRLRRLRRLLLASALTAFVGAMVIIVAGYAYLQSLPSVSDAQQRVDTILREHHGVAVGTPPPLRVGQAIVAVEDQRFYSNHGIDTVSMLHFAWGYLTIGSTNQGGATISEQLVKRLYVRQPTTLGGKFEMLGLALKLDQQYSKPQILEMYLNAIYYGDQAYGIEQASQTYFHTSADQLTWGEASLLAGLPQAPSAYDPLKHYDLARLRQQHVLSRLVATGVLTPAQAAAAYAETPRLP
ncbi:MAG TPA: biosynthetic peptidoglycan transglycosylase [Ktedonobacterales bacterium]|nr:biosynthetic peptidoglycan transglycosylase [Ktedonobacterales bacterium]